MLSTQEKPNEWSTLGENVEFDPHNKRIKVYGLSDSIDMKNVSSELKNWALDHECDKIIFYSTDGELALDEDPQCSKEGMIDGFFQGEDAHIYSMFLTSSRRKPIDNQQEEKVMQIVSNDHKSAEKTLLPEGYYMRTATEHDATAMAKLYGQVFKTYPTPMDDPEFILKMMNDQVYFTVVEYQGELISSCSADVFPEYNVAEMTDCATLPEHRGKGLLSQQFSHLENGVEKKGVKSLFSMTRAVSVGMNLINSRHGYEYRGRLIQNTNISGRFEDMNIWVKTL